MENLIWHGMNGALHDRATSFSAGLSETVHNENADQSITARAVGRDRRSGCAAERDRERHLPEYAGSSAAISGAAPRQRSRPSRTPERFRRTAMADFRLPLLQTYGFAFTRRCVGRPSLSGANVDLRGAPGPVDQRLERPEESR